jgi:hypothetical protein
MTQLKTEQISESPFESHVREVAFRIRQILAELSAAAAIDISQPRSAARELDIDKTLAWKISKITTGPDPVAAMSLLPGSASLKTLFRAFSKAGVPSELVDQARAVLDEFQQMVEQHADDRETFEMMLSPLSNDDQQSREEAQRKLAFQGNSAIWGMHCRMRTWAYIVCPSDDPALGDVAVLGSFVDVRRLRRDIRMTLATIAAVNDDGRPMGDSPIRPLDPAQAEFDGMPVLPEFCRGPVPLIKRVRGQNGMTNYRLMEGEVGNAGAFTWSIGWRHSKVIARWRTEQDRQGEFGVNILIPAETALLDIFVHKDFWSNLDPEVSVFSLLPGEAPVAHPATDRQKIRMHQPVDRLHQNPLDLTVHDVPNYSQMFEWAFSAMGHKSSEFAGYRVRMKYPILSSAMYMRFDLPEKPA